MTDLLWWGMLLAVAVQLGLWMVRGVQDPAAPDERGGLSRLARVSRLTMLAIAAFGLALAALWLRRGATDAALLEGLAIAVVLASAVLLFVLWMRVAPHARVDGARAIGVLDPTWAFDETRFDESVRPLCAPARRLYWTNLVAGFVWIVLLVEPRS